MPSKPLDNISVVLVEPSAPGNIGAAARALKNTGISRLKLVNPGNWDTPETRWMAHGSDDILNACEIYPDLPSAIASAHIVIGTTHRRRRFRDVDSTPREIIASLAPQAHHHQIALVFGREKDGLWQRELKYCHHLLCFPSAVSHPSLNLSQAVLLFAYEFFITLSATSPPPFSHLVDANQLEQLYAHIRRAMEIIDFRPYNDMPDHFDRLVRRFFDRIALERRDAMVLHKMCGQIQKFASRFSAGKSSNSNSDIS